MKPREIAVFSQNDSYGDAAFHGVVKALRPLVDDVKAILHVRDTAQSGDGRCQRRRGRDRAPPGDPRRGHGVHV